MRSQKLAEAEQSAPVWPPEVTQQRTITRHPTAELVHTPAPRVMQRSGGKDLPETRRKSEKSTLAYVAILMV